MKIPLVQNLEWLLNTAPYPSYDEQLAILRVFCNPINMWLNETKIAGNSKAINNVKILFNIYTSIIDFRHIKTCNINDNIYVIREITRRLAGLNEITQ